MAESAVFHLLANFAPFLQQEANLLTGVRDEIQYIRDEFDRMTAFLRVADAMEENNPELKVWVKQVREAAYDIGDVLELFMLRLGHCHGSGFRSFLRKVACFIKTLKARHQIASEVQRMKASVIDISNGHQRYHERYGMLEAGSSSKSTGFNKAWHDCRGDALLLDEAELVGIDEPKSELIWWLVHEDPRLKVLSVSGMGGLGKTTLVKKVFDDAVVKKHFQNYAWITVSESFNIKELLKGMIKQLFEEVNQPVPQGVEYMDMNSLKGIIHAFLQQKRYLLVFDDVWDIHAWQSFRYVFPIGNCGSRVVVTTRNADLASFSSKEYHGDVYNLQPLPPKESWTLFCRKTFMENSCPSHLEGLSRAILNRCEGLPLAIVTISGLLSTKDKSNVDEWDKIYRSLGSELQGNDKLLSMKKILSLSYIDLPYYLKFLEKLSNLRSLVVRATGEDEIIDLDSLSSPPQLLRTLYLVGSLHKVPHWIPSLHSLVRVVLAWSKLRDVDPLESLQDLPNLVELQLLQTYEGAKLCFKASGFQRLVRLALSVLKGLRWVKVEAGSMPHLEELLIRKCELVEELPSGIEHLTNLKSLYLVDMSNGLSSSLNRDLKDGNYWKIAHIPEVGIVNTKRGYVEENYL